MATERHYTHSIVSYANLDEIRRLLNLSKYWAYICHDKDEGKSTHYHIVATFDTAKSFKWVREQVISDQNTFTEAIKGELIDVFEYFTHKGLKDKYNYCESDIVYSDKTYWNRRLDNGEDEENKNEKFMDDLLSCDFSAEKMGRKYGRDFIKNYKSYMYFREVVIDEKMNELLKESHGIRTMKNEIYATITPEEYKLINELRLNKEN